MREISQLSVERHTFPHLGEALTATIETEAVQDKCGVIGVIGRSEDDVAGKAHDGLRRLQHRGYDASGMALYVRDQGFVVQQGVGTMRDIFPDGADTLRALTTQAHIGVGHNRYGTTGELSEYEAELAAQPFVDRVATAHNGNVENAVEVAALYGVDPSTCASDSIAIGKSINALVQDGMDTQQATTEIASKLEGSFSLIVTDGTELHALRDPNGNRPLSIGRLPRCWVFASETVALDAVGAVHFGDVRGGEMVSVHTDRLSSLQRTQYAEGTPALCGMEPPYIADPKSILGGPQGELGESLRQAMGRRLAEEHPIEPSDDPVVVGIPASGVAAAKGYAEALGLRYVDAIEKVKDERSFMLQGTEEERQAVTTNKLRIYIDLLKGMRVVAVDDSIVRGNASRVITRLLREAGATEVHFRSSFPQINAGCHLGIDSGKEEELLTHTQEGNPDRMRDYVGADVLTYISAEGYRSTLEPTVGRMCLGCVDGNYPVPRRTPAVNILGYAGQQ